METVVLVAAIVAAALVMASGIWVVAVLLATMTRVKPPTSPSPAGQPDEPTSP
ncbi:MAG: hypothetical protein MUC88_27710 [Planctomycetes bacterium]|jgi:hypothetical protein|nr:hypothetical protein [Planctomycetota bacterium]